MKKIILGSLAFLPVMTWAQSNNFTLKVKIGQLTAPAKAYLLYRPESTTIRDSVSISGGMFQFQGSIPEPTEALIVVDHQGLGWHKMDQNTADLTYIFLEKENIDITTKDSLKNAIITGSKVTDEYLEYNKLVAPVKAHGSY